MAESLIQRLLTPDGVSDFERGLDSNLSSSQKRVVIPVSRPTLAKVDLWFNSEVLPRRTVRAGFSLNRVWKGPRDLVKGNREDPDGLCGDAVMFVFEEFLRKFDASFDTADGYFLAAILWDGTVLNHIANVMLKKDKVSTQTYRWDSVKNAAVATTEKGQYDTKELLSLRVYDLYYKKIMNVNQWWYSLDHAKGGTIRLAPYWEM